MPHLIIEHTDKTADYMPEICQAVFKAACGCSTFTNPAAIKVRSCLCANHTGGVGDDFVHVTVRVFEGRSDTEKSEVSRAVMDVLIAALPDTPSLNCEIVDIHTASYAKHYIQRD